MSNELNEIITSQAEWAESRGIPFDKSKRCGTFGQNLFMPLTPGSVEEFGEGAGNELGTSDAPGSMASLRSCSMVNRSTVFRSVAWLLCSACWLC